MNKYVKVPGPKQILEDFEESRGNVAVFLDNVTPDDGEREQILYVMLSKLRRDPADIDRWEELKLLGDYTVATMLHSKLLKKCEGNNMEPGEMLRMLERLNPETWARKSMAQPKGQRGVGVSTKLDDLMKEFDE